MEASGKHQLSHSTEIAVYEEKSRELAVQSLGKHALQFEGFTPLEEVESRFSHLLEELDARVVGHTEAKKAIVEALERSDIRLPDDNTPITVLGFLGQTGVGKTEMAKALADYLGNGNERLLRIDVANFSEKHQVNQVFGSPPGYIDGEIVPLLSPENVERYDGGITVILFDEIEKGCLEFYTMLLAVMEEGELRMARGAVTKFRNTVLIYTSNLGAAEMAKVESGKGIGFSNPSNKSANDERVDQIGISAFKKAFPTEFVNRVDDLIVFHKLDAEGLDHVLDIKLNKLNTEYERQYGVRLSLSEATRKHLVDIAMQEQEYGARPLVRALKKEILTPFGRQAKGVNVGEGTEVKVFHISEAPANYNHTAKSPLIFTSKPDATIQKERPPYVLPASIEEFDEMEAEESLANDVIVLPTNPQTMYDIADETDEMDFTPQDLDITDDDIPIQPISGLPDEYWKRPPEEPPVDEEPEEPLAS